MSTRLYTITGEAKKLNPGTQELELCKYHAERWQSAGYQVQTLEKRTKSLWWGAEADGKHCEWCDSESEGY